jgi:hypothetical protein
MATKSFLERMKPFNERSRPLEWPFQFDGEERPVLTMRTLSATEIGVADTASVDHFRKLKEQQPKKERAGWEPSPAARTLRDRAEAVFRAFTDADGKPIAPTVDEVAALPPQVLNTLFAEWDRFQDEVAAFPASKEEMRELIDDLKKNTQGVPLRAWPSSWLIELVRFLVDQLPPSTQESSRG